MVIHIEMRLAGRAGSNGSRQGDQQGLAVQIPLGLSVAFLPSGPQAGTLWNEGLLAYLTNRSESFFMARLYTERQRNGRVIF